MIWFWLVVVGTVCLSVGVCWGVAVAEKSAVYHADCSTAHHMRGGFYYIVPESEYVKLVMLKYAPNHHPKENRSDDRG